MVNVALESNILINGILKLNYLRADNTVNKRERKRLRVYCDLYHNYRFLVFN